ncbi:MAG: hypothetical protein K2J73_03755 [Oscillospiraceae bacterium]|nr:hypothetical protein [Oscillospiraceae bacterium]
MKMMAALLIILICIAGLTIGVNDNDDAFNASSQSQSEKIHDDISAENIRHVNISGNARSIVIRQSADEYFEFHNGDLNAAHKYEVRCDENGGTIDINVMMENAEDDNNVLGSVLIDIPQKEFEQIEVSGEFGNISLYTLNSDVMINANGSFVILDLEADDLKHNITLDGSESKAFRGVSVYLDKFPDNVNMKLNLLQGGKINDPQNILKKNVLEAGAEKPIISISNTREINIYSKE